MIGMALAVVFAGRRGVLHARDLRAETVRRRAEAAALAPRSFPCRDCGRRFGVAEHPPRRRSVVTFPACIMYCRGCLDAREEAENALMRRGSNTLRHWYLFGRKR